MLNRRRGAIRDKSRKMAKKAAPAALQTEVNTDEEFDKILERQGLVLVDVYSEWSGPCTGMVSVLKKVKMEIGGDNLSYAVAKCDNITMLARFRGKSEPTWMFLRNGMMVNLIFGADCPELLNVLTKELKRLQTGGPPEYSIPVTEMSPLEAKRIQEMEEMIKAREAEKLAKIEAEATRKFEAELAHLLEVLPTETAVIMFPSVFTDDEGKKREKRSSPAYLELTDQLITGAYRVEQEIWKEFDEDILEVLLKESGWEDFSDYTKYLLLNGKSLCLRLKSVSSDIDVNEALINIIYGEPQIPESPDLLVEGCFAQRYLPHAVRNSFADEESIVSNADKLLNILTVFIPFNSRNRVWVVRNVFSAYVEKQYPFEDTEAVIPVTLFKYDSTRKKELQVVLEMYQNDVVEFGVFERDKLPDPKRIATSIKEFDYKFKEKTSYEVFIVAVKKSTSQSFLSFAGIGPYYVSENEEKAIEEMEQYFPPTAEVPEEVASDYAKSDDEREEGEEGEEEEDDEEEAANEEEDLTNLMFL